MPKLTLQFKKTSTEMTSEKLRYVMMFLSMKRMEVWNFQRMKVMKLEEKKIRTKNKQVRITWKSIVNTKLIDY